MACGLYDRMLDLYRGDVRPDGITLNFIPMDGSAGAREIFDRMAGNLEFDVAEMSSSEFVARKSAGKAVKSASKGKRRSSPRACSGTAWWRSIGVPESNRRRTSRAGGSACRSIR